jgi:hypothetical protein
MNTLALNPVATATAARQIGRTIDQANLLGPPESGRLDKTDDRALAVTTLLRQIISRQDSVPRWGINE